MRLDKLKKKFNKRSGFVAVNSYEKFYIPCFYAICPNCKDKCANYKVLMGEKNKEGKSNLYLVCSKCFMVYRLKKSNSRRGVCRL